MVHEKYHIAVPTAFYDDESLNIQATIEHIRYLYKLGVKSVLVCGTTGEQHSLDCNEKLLLLHSLEREEELISNMEILFGVSSIRQAEALKLAEAVSQTRIAGILLGYSPYIIPTQEEALVYSKQIIESCKKPTIIYNNPKRTGFDLSIESIEKLSRLDKVVGIKEAGAVSKVMQLRAIIQKPFYYYAGGELGLGNKIEKGFNRLSSISGNLYPNEIHNWFFELLEGRKEMDNSELESLISDVFSGSPLVHLKREISRKGIAMGVCRGPLGN